MPIYMYRCGECNETHEALQKVSDAPLTTCTHCGAEALRKVIAPVGIIFKGSGFHKNDYSGAKSGAGAASPATAPAASEGGESSTFKAGESAAPSGSASSGGSGGSTGGDGGGSGPAPGSNQVA